jgi:hypothetical protein
MMEDGAPSANPDAAQDYDMICNVMEEKLVPVFTMIGKEIKDLHEDLGELQGLVFKLMTSMIGAADDHKRGGYQEMLKSQFGQDIEPLDGFYQDTQGKKFSDELLDGLMGEEGLDEAGTPGFIKSKIEEAKGKFGKYLGGAAPAGGTGEGEMPAGGAPEVKAEIAPAEATVMDQEVAPSPGQPADQVDKLMSKLGGLRRSK